MLPQVKFWLNTISSLTIIVVLTTTLFLFWNFTSEPFEIPKLIVLIIAILVLLVVGAINLLIEGKVAFRKTPLDLPLLMLLIVLGVSTFFSGSHQISIFGNFPKFHSGLIAQISYVLLYFVCVARLKGEGQIRNLLWLLTLGGVILGLITLLSYFGIPLPFSLVNNPNFTLTGSSFSTAAILTLLLPLPIFETISNSDNPYRKLIPHLAVKGVWAVIVTLLGIVILLTGSLAVYIGSVLALFLTLTSVRQSELKKNYLYIAVPIVVIVIIGVLSFIKLPLPNNPLYNRAHTLTAEVSLPFSSSWKISVSAFRDSPFWGTGPATYLFDFSSYKPLEFNNTSVWNRRFDSPFNEYFGVLATLGGTGLLGTLLLAVVFLSLALKLLVWSGHQPGNLVQALAVSGIVYFIILAFHPATLPFQVIGVFLLASFIVASGRLGSYNISDSFEKLSSDTTQAVESIPGILVMLSLAIVVSVVFFGSKFVLADLHHKSALSAYAQNQGIQAYNELVKAEGLNPYIDAYRIDLAQTNFALANAIALSKAPSQASPSGNLSDADKQNIQTLLSQAITEARAATTISPNNPANWEALATIYRQIAGVAQNALVFSLDAYGKAIQKDPFNPILRLNAGGVYYSVKNYELAIRLFTDAIALKPDYVNGYYNLAVAFRDKGDLANAVTAAEKAVSSVNDKSSTDYQVANNLLTELKNKQNPKEASQSAGLSNESLPKVLNLPKPDKIATPPAVKKK